MAMLPATTWVHVLPIASRVFFTCNKVSSLNNRIPNPKVCAMCPNKLAQSYQRHM